MKKILAFILALVVALSLFGCGKTASQELPTINTSEQSQTVQEPQINIVDKEEDNEEQPQAPPQEAVEDEKTEEPMQNADVPEELPDEHGTYDSVEDVALYINVYGHLPDNYMKKKEANALGWSGGSLEQYAPGMCIGGDKFGNYEGKLPQKEGRKYTECDIDTLGAKSRGAKRIIFSNDGLIYYTEDHYETFTLLYGEE